MPSDRSRGFDDLGQSFKAVVMQQGRVILDRDFNALQEIVNARTAADALDEIGPCGTPDNGFAISLPPANEPASSSGWSFSRPNHEDFLISCGTMYVGGERVILRAPPSGGRGFLLDSLGQPSWSYFNQPDWLTPDNPPAFSGPSKSGNIYEFVCLHAFEQEVGSIEDPELLDVALGGPDTTQRVRLMWRVERIQVGEMDCAAALLEATNTWLKQGYLFDPNNMRLWPQARCQTKFTAAPSTSNPCDPIVQGGYLGADNQLIRLQIAEPLTQGGVRQERLLWGYDNASFLYGIGSVQPNGKTLSLNQVPVDAFHCPKTNQVVEILRSAAKLEADPDGTVPTDVAGYAAEATGIITSVASYSANDNTVLLNSALPADFLHDSNPLYLRVWQGLQNINPTASQPVVLTDSTDQTNLGIQVAITLTAAAKGSALPVGAFWMIAVRPSTPQQVYPQRFLDSPQRPDGARQWMCPLAVIDWKLDRSFSQASSAQLAANICDCRKQFDNLVTLTGRLGGCCTFTVGPKDAGQLQSILDRAAQKGGLATICFTPGNYNLVQPLRLTDMHSNLVLEACHGGVTLSSAQGVDAGLFQDGLIVLVGADNVTLRGLNVVPTPSAFPENLSNDVRKFGLLPDAIPMVAMIGLRVISSLDLTVQACTIEFPAPTLTAREALLGVGLLAAGDCSGLKVVDCQFTSLIALTSTPQLGDGLTRVAPAVAVSQQYVILFGIMALPSLSAGKVLAANIGDASIRDNKFVNLTMAVYADGDMGKLQLQDNRVTGSLSGFWLMLSNYQPPSDTNAANMFASATAIVEILSGLIWAIEYPLPSVAATAVLALSTVAATAPSLLSPPAAPSAPRFTPPIRFHVENVLPASSPPAHSIPASSPAPIVSSFSLALRNLDVTSEAAATNTTSLKIVSLGIHNNYISAAPSTLVGNANAYGSIAMMVLASQATNTNLEEYATSLILNANTIYGRSLFRYAPIVGLVISGPTAMTGNVIVQEYSHDGINSSLAIYPPFETNVSLLAVTGNVFVGKTNLASLTTLAFAPPLNTWSPINSNNG